MGSSQMPRHAPLCGTARTSLCMAEETLHDTGLLDEITLVYLGPQPQWCSRNDPSLGGSKRIRRCTGGQCRLCSALFECARRKENANRDAKARCAEQITSAQRTAELAAQTCC